jgi:hypothetical protein
MVIRLSRVTLCRGRVRRKARRITLASNRDERKAALAFKTNRSSCAPGRSLACRTAERVHPCSGIPKIESTVRYLGIEVDDAIEIAEKIDI